MEIWGNYIRIGVNGTWGNARVKTQLVDMFEEEDQTLWQTTSGGTARKTKRAQFFSIGHTKETWVEGKEFQSDFNNATPASSGETCAKTAVNWNQAARSTPLSIIRCSVRQMPT